MQGILNSIESVPIDTFILVLFEILERGFGDVGHDSRSVVDVGRAGRDNKSTAIQEVGGSRLDGCSTCCQHARNVVVADGSKERSDVCLSRSAMTALAN